MQALVLIYKFINIYILICFISPDIYCTKLYFIYRVSQKNGDLEFLTFSCCVRAQLYDHFRKKSTLKSNLGVFIFHTNVDLFLKWSYNRALNKLQKFENSKSPF